MNETIVVIYFVQYFFISDKRKSILTFLGGMFLYIFEHFLFYKFYPEKDFCLFEDKSKPKHWQMLQFFLQILWHKIFVQTFSHILSKNKHELFPQYIFSQASFEQPIQPQTYSSPSIILNLKYTLLVENPEHINSKVVLFATFLDRICNFWCKTAFFQIEFNIICFKNYCRIFQDSKNDIKH